MGTIPASENVFPIVRMAEVAAPATPPTGEAHLYVKSSGLLYWKDDAGTEYPVSQAADLAAHLADSSDAHDASAVSVADSGNHFTATDVEAALAELFAAIAGGGIPASTVNAKGDLLAATADDTVTRLAVGSNGLVLSADSAESTGLKWNTLAALLAQSENRISGDVTMTNANQFYDGPSLSLDGTYLLMGCVTVKATAATDFTAKLWNGTTVETSGALTVHANTYHGCIHLSGFVTTSGPETWKISVAANGTGGTIKAAATNNGAGNNASFLNALKLA